MENKPKKKSIAREQISKYAACARRHNITLERICLIHGIDEDQVISYQPGDPRKGISAVVIYRDNHGAESQISVPLTAAVGAEIEEALLTLDKAVRTIEITKYLDNKLRAAMKRTGLTADRIIRDALVLNLMPSGEGGGYYFRGRQALEYLSPLLYGERQDFGDVITTPDTEL